MISMRPVLWRVANRWGPRRLRAWCQNDQYRTGRWARLAGGRRPAVVALVSELAAGGDVVEFGCGEGHLARAVDPACYSTWVGYDIAALAVEGARQRSESDRCRFQVLDCTAWPGASGVQLIVAEECLYYLHGSDLHRFLERCRASLAPDGAMLVTFSRAGRHPEAEAACELAFPAVDLVDDPAGGRYLVLRPGSRAEID